MIASRKTSGLWFLLALAVSCVTASPQPIANGISSTQDEASQGSKTTFIYKRIANADISADVYRPREVGLRPVLPVFLRISTRKPPMWLESFYG